MKNVLMQLIGSLVPVATVFGAVVAYLVFYARSKPEIAVYYQASSRQQSMIELVIENIGAGSAFDVKFSRALPVNWLGIEEPEMEYPGGFIPRSGVPCLVPGQRLVFCGGQYSGLLNKVGDGFELKIEYKFHPPLWCESLGFSRSKIGVKHFCSMATSRSVDQVLVDALTGRNSTTILDISKALQRIDTHLAALSGGASRERKMEPQTRESLRNAQKKEAAQN